MAVLNSDIMSSSWLSGSNSFQQRVPDPTQASLDAVFRALFDPMNNDLYNEWSAGLINRIGMTIAERQRFRNPLAIFKKPNMPYGRSIQVIACNWAKAHMYKDDLEDLLKYERTDFVNAFASVDRFDKYKVSVTRLEMRQAVAQDGYGINELLDSAMASVTNADEYDEMNIMLQLFAMYQRDHGMYNYNLSAAPTDKATAQEMLAAVKEIVNRLQFPTTIYNAQDVTVPTFARAEDMVILADPKTMAALDVYAFADLFHEDVAKTRARMVLVPEFPMPNTHAILTTKDAFICADTEYGMFPFFDPNTLTTHNFLHHQGVYALNPFVPMVRFSTDAGTNVPTVTQAVTGVTVTAENPTVIPGGTDKIMVELNGTITGTGSDAYSVEPDAVTWTITALNAAETDAVALNSRTYIDRFGVLHVQKTGLEAGDTITVAGTAIYINPSTGAATEYEDSATITVA